MRWSVVVALALSACGCGSEPPPACITVDPACTPLLYVPSFDNVYANTLGPHCGSKDSSCHSAQGHAAGLSFDDEQTAYDGLLAKSSLDSKRNRVVPGDPGCSLMIVRTDSPGKDYQMPPGDPLPEAERCALVQWVAKGAGSGSGL